MVGRVARRREGAIRGAVVQNDDRVDVLNHAPAEPATTAGPAAFARFFIDAVCRAPLRSDYKAEAPMTSCHHARSASVVAARSRRRACHWICSRLPTEMCGPVIA